MSEQGNLRAVNARLRNIQYDSTVPAAITRCVPPCPGTIIVRKNCVRKTSVKRRNKIVYEITRNVANVANVFSFYAIITLEHGFSSINICQVPREVLKTEAGLLHKNSKHLLHFALFRALFLLWPRFSTPPSGPGEC